MRAAVPDLIPLSPPKAVHASSRQIVTHAERTGPVPAVAPGRDPAKVRRVRSTHCTPLRRVLQAIAGQLDQHNWIIPSPRPKGKPMRAWADGAGPHECGLAWLPPMRTGLPGPQRIYEPGDAWETAMMGTSEMVASSSCNESASMSSPNAEPTPRSAGARVRRTRSGSAFCSR